MKDTILKENQNGSYFVFNDKQLQQSYSFLYQEKIHQESHILYASISKVFITASLIKLHHKGKISLDSKLSHFFPEVEAENDCSIKKIMLHECNLKGSEYPLEELETISINELFLKNNNGKFIYSNIGYVILDQIIKKLGTSPLREVNLSKYGIMSGESCLNGALIKSFELDEGVNYRLLKKYTVLRYGAGGNYCGTPKALIHWSQDLFNGKILNLAEFKMLVSANHNNIGYGLYFDSKNKEIIYFRGDMDGFMVQLTYNQNKKKGILFVANSTSYYHFKSYQKVQKILNGDFIESPEEFVQTLEPEVGSEYFDHEGKFIFKILESKNEVLVIKSLKHEQPIHLKRVGNTFYNSYLDIRATFEKKRVTIYFYGYRHDALLKN